MGQAAKPFSAALIAVFNPWKSEADFNILACVHTLENDGGNKTIEVSEIFQWD